MNSIAPLIVSFNGHSHILGEALETANAVLGDSACVGVAHGRIVVMTEKNIPLETIVAALETCGFSARVLVDKSVEKPRHIFAFPLCSALQASKN